MCVICILCSVRIVPHNMSRLCCLPVYLTNYRYQSHSSKNPEINNTSHAFYGTQSFKNLIQVMPWYFCKNRWKCIYKRVQVFSFSSVSAPKPVNVFLFLPTRATFTANHIQLFAVQYKSWGYLLRSFLPILSPYYTNTYSSVLIYIYLWLVNLFDALCFCHTLYCNVH